jgi:hypothetical protein
MGSEYSSCGRLHCRIVRERAGDAGVSAEERFLGWPEQHLRAATAGEPLGYPEYALRFIDGVAELAHARGNGAYEARGPWKAAGAGNGLDVFFERPGCDQYPVFGQLAADHGVCRA